MPNQGQTLAGTSALRRSTRIQARAAETKPHSKVEEQTLPTQTSASRQARKKEPTKLQSKGTTLLLCLELHLQRLQDAKPASRPTAQSTRKADADFKKNRTQLLAHSRETKKAPPKYVGDSPQTSQRKSRSGKSRLAKGAAKSSRSTWNKKTHISSPAEQEAASSPSESSQARTDRNLLDLPTEEVPQPATSSRALSEQALQELTRGLKSIDEARRRNGGADLPDGSFAEPDSEQGSAEAGLDPWTAFTHK
ncbi:MAG: hypothetical protein Q9164_001154 [Protoblastenia rupestris]